MTGWLYLHTLKMAGMMPVSVLRKLILSGNVYEGKYEQVRTCTPRTSRLGLNGRHVGASSNEWCNCSKSRVRTFSRRDSLLAFTLPAISYIFYNISENRKKYNYKDFSKVEKTAFQDNWDLNVDMRHISQRYLNMEFPDTRTPITLNYIKSDL